MILTGAQEMILLELYSINSYSGFLYIYEDSSVVSSIDKVCLFRFPSVGTVKQQGLILVGNFWCIKR